ncbi:MAG: glycosyltransferase [bacterium]
MGIERVVIVHSYAQWGGNLKIVYSIIEHLINIGLDVGFAYPKGINYIERFKDLSIIPIEYNWKNKSDILGQIDFILKIKRFNPALMHSHSRQADLITAITSLILGIPAITTQHAPINIDEDTFMPKRDISAQIYRFILRTIFKKVIIVSNYLYREIRKEAFHIPNKKIVIIPNGIEPLIKTNRRIRKEMQFKNNEIVITEIGTLSKKGHTDLIKAGKYLIDKGYNVQFLIVGKGREEEALINLAESLNISSKFHFLGFREDIEDLLSSTDIFVLPSYSEGLPVSILEAMCLGKAIIATPVGGIKDAIIDGITGLLVNTNSSVEIVNAIRTLIYNAELRNNLGENARKFFYKNFTIDRMLNDYVNLYKTLIKFK